MNEWQHQFAPISKEYVGDDGKMWRNYECTFCHKLYTHGKESRPSGECAVRTDKKERSRLFR